MQTILLPLHIAAGVVAITCGLFALFLRKGTRTHFKIGNLFFYSMLCMAGSASILAINASEEINALIGAFTLYLVLTGKWTANNRTGQNTSKEKIGGALALILFAGFLILSIQAMQSGATAIDGVYVEAFYVYTVLALLALILDFKVLLKGGVYGAQRIARHLWRMILGLFVAAGAFFFGQPQVFPEVIRESGLLSVPPFLVLVFLLVWLVLVYKLRRYKPRKGY